MSDKGVRIVGGTVGIGVPGATTVITHKSQIIRYAHDMSGPVLQDVVWQNIVNCTAVGNTLEKTAGGSAWNAGANSVQSFSGDGYVEWTVTDVATVASKICGAAAAAAGSDASWETINYGGYHHSSDTFRIAESGVYFPAALVSLVNGDVVRVVRTGTVITYLVNDVLEYTSLTPSTGSLHADASIYDVGSTTSNVMIYGNLA